MSKGLRCILCRDVRNTRDGMLDHLTDHSPRALAEELARLAYPPPPPAPTPCGKRSWPTKQAALEVLMRAALLMRNNSSKGDGGEMCTPAFEAMRTLTTKGHQSVLTPGDLEAARAEVDDCLFRMLEPHEVAAGMAFPGDYKWEGNRRQRVKLMGNAVTPPAARDLMATVAESLDGAA